MNNTILFIDDDTDFRETITWLLQDAGFNVIPLSDSRELDNILKKGKPALAIIDYFLPNETGLSISQKIMAQKRGDEIKILMISSHENIWPTLKKGGIKHFLAKPFDPSELVTKIKKILN